MTKDFATFDCDAHIVEPARVWERAADNLTRDELEALKSTMWYDAESKQLLVNGKADINSFSPTPKTGPGMIDIVRLAGPGLKHDIQRALNVRNLHLETALTQEQSDYLAHAGADEPGPRLRDMDVQGIDQVMIIPTSIDTYPWLQNALGARAMCKAYNDWAYEYTQEDPERLFFAALIPMQNPQYAAEEVYRVAAKGCRVALIRPMDAMGNYPLQPSTRACGTRWRTPGWSTVCTPSRPRARPNRPVTPTSIRERSLSGRPSPPPACPTPCCPTCRTSRRKPPCG